MTAWSFVAASGILALALVAHKPVSAQGPGGPAGTGNFDFSGEYAPVFHEEQPERLGGPEIGDYLGMPITPASRLHGDSWSASLLTMPEHQCKPHPSDYGVRGPANLRISKEVDPASQQLVAFHTLISWQTPQRTIWMDGRPHPPEYAVHTWQGFSTGRFDGDQLVINTTHLKQGWIRRNGLPRSDLATFNERLAYHAGVLMLMTIVNDPIYLSEPFVRTTNFTENKRQVIAPYPCYPAVEIDRPTGVVPNNVLDGNKGLQEFSERFSIPYEATRGGAETMYPEYQLKLAAMPKPVKK